MFIEKVGLIKEIFVATNKFSVIKSIFIFLENSTDQLLPFMNKTFGNPKLKSETSMDSEYVWSKMFWNKNNISVFLDKSKQSKSIKILITHFAIDDKKPGINIY